MNILIAYGKSEVMQNKLLFRQEKQTAALVSHLKNAEEKNSQPFTILNDCSSSLNCSMSLIHLALISFKTCV